MESRIPSIKDRVESARSRLSTAAPTAVKTPVPQEGASAPTFTGIKKPQAIVRRGDFLATNMPEDMIQHGFECASVSHHGMEGKYINIKFTSTLNKSHVICARFLHQYAPRECDKVGVWFADSKCGTRTDVCYKEIGTNLPF